MLPGSWRKFGVNPDISEDLTRSLWGKKTVQLNCTPLNWLPFWSTGLLNPLQPNLLWWAEERPRFVFIPIRLQWNIPHLTHFPFSNSVYIRGKRKHSPILISWHIYTKTSLLYLTFSQRLFPMADSDNGHLFLTQCPPLRLPKIISCMNCMMAFNIFRYVSQFSASFFAFRLLAFHFRYYYVVFLGGNTKTNTITVWLRKPKDERIWTSDRILPIPVLTVFSLVGANSLPWS